MTGLKKEKESKTKKKKEKNQLIAFQLKKLIHTRHIMSGDQVSTP